MVRAVVYALALSIALAGSAIAQGCSGLTTIANGTNADATLVMGNFTTLLNCINGLAMPRGYLSGLTLSTGGGSVSFAVAAGVAAADTSSTPANLPMNLTAPITKTTSAWTVGSNNGALDTGAIAASTWYHVFLIERTDTGVVDVLVSQSAASPTLPSGYAAKRRIGSMKTNGSGQWVAFTQTGDDFVWATTTTDYSNSPISNQTLTLTLNVPTGAVVKSNIRALYNNPGTNTALNVFETAISSPVGSTIIAAGSGNYGAGAVAVNTNTSSQINISTTATGGAFWIYTLGWSDRRGGDL